MNFAEQPITSEDFQKLRSVLLVGAGGITGLWYSRLLLRNRKTIYAYDGNESVQYPEELTSHEQFHIVSRQEFTSGEILSKVDGVTLSPGVPLSQPIFQMAAQMENAPLVFSELEYCFEQLFEREWICITGTDGKSTVTSLIAHLFNENALPAMACGNFKTPFSQILVEPERFSGYRYLIAELSSYQLELSRNLKPAAALYLNLAPDHLNRYDDIEHYGLTKWNLFQNMSEGLCLINQKLFPPLCSWWKTSHPAEKIPAGCRKVLVDDEKLSSENFYWLKETLYYKKSSGEAFEHSEPVVSLDQLAVSGRHNCANILFAMEVYFYFTQKSSQAKGALCRYRGLPHRFERIITTDGNLYINDSKATTTQATLAALSSVSPPLVLFLGGQSKGEDYAMLAPALLEKEAELYLYGENRNEIKESLEAHGVPIAGVWPDLDTAFHDACAQTKAKYPAGGLTFLLAPAATSWDQYASFEKRGDHFRQLVEKQSAGR